MKHCRGLNFEEKPDYQLLIDLLRGLALKEGLDLDFRGYDWVAKVLAVPKPLAALVENPPPLPQE
jgi:hypothetical protein